MEHQIVTDEIKDTLTTLERYIQTNGYDGLYPFK